MKPKTKMQREIVKLSKTLPKITPKQEQWAYDNCFDKTAFYSKGNAWCSHCGKYFPIDGTSELIEVMSGGVTGNKTKCPHCGTTLHIKVSLKQKLEEKWYYAIITTCKGYQVCRHFIAKKYIRRGGMPFYSCDEVVQNWIAPDGHDEVIARPVRPMTYVYDAWNFSKPMELRSKRQRINYNRYTPNKYEINTGWTYPVRKLTPLVRRNGYTARCTSVPQSELIKMLLTDREAEGLIKNKQFSILGYKYQRGEYKLPFYHSIRIANRNRYIVKDASLWYDYLRLLEYFRLDTHNAYYVCPSDLKAEHDRLLRRKQRIENKKAEEEKLREAAKWEQQYKEDKGKFFGIHFGDGNITVTVIQSVADMVTEGAAMHHCVYDMGYYKRAYSLILSARDRKNNRVETVEVSLKTFKIVQSRAVCNGTSIYHDEIIDLVNKNMNLIRQAM